MTIKEVVFNDSDHRYGDKQADVVLEDGTERTAFVWFSDELDFTEEELIGLTVEQAQDLKIAKDAEYLQS